MTIENAYRPRRSCLYMPGANVRALEKAQSLPADMLILDLEDAVAPELKAQARDNVSKAVQDGGYGEREVVVRTNSLATEWGPDDLAMVAAVSPDGVLIPKVECADDIRKIDVALGQAGAPADLGLWVMIEMPRAILRIEEIAAASRDTRLAGFVMGTNDLGKEFNAVATPDRQAFQVSLGLSLAAARAYGLAAIDGVFNDIKDETGLTDECRQGRVLGFDGKTLIHPAQLEIANKLFSPDPEDVAQARAVIAAFSLPENRGKGVIKVGGKMTELLHLEQAQRLVAIDDAIVSRQSV